MSTNPNEQRLHLLVTPAFYNHLIGVAHEAETSVSRTVATALAKAIGWKANPNPNDTPARATIAKPVEDTQADQAPVLTRVLVTPAFKAEIIERARRANKPVLEYAANLASKQLGWHKPAVFQRSRPSRRHSKHDSTAANVTIKLRMAPKLRAHLVKLARADNTSLMEYVAKLLCASSRWKRPAIPSHAPTGKPSKLACKEHQILSMHMAGKPQSEISARFGVSQSWISRFLRRNAQHRDRRAIRTSARPGGDMVILQLLPAFLYHLERLAASSGHQLQDAMLTWIVEELDWKSQFAPDRKAPGRKPVDPLNPTRQRS